MSGEPVRQPGESIASFARRRAGFFGIEVRAPRSAPKQAAPVEEDLIPDIDLTPRSQQRYEMDAVLDGVDIVDAYNRWCGKMHCDPKGKTESIMVSCPNPAHPDVHPSAWLSTDKGEGGVGNCPQCGGFDKYDIAAWRFGYNVPGYKSKEDFPKLREEMAEDLGYKVMTAKTEAGKEEWLEKKTEAPAPTNTSSPESAPPTITSSPVEPSSEAISPKSNDETDDDEATIYGLNEVFEEPHLDWRTIPSITEGTFLHEWMTLTSQSYEPEEFYLFEGFMALGAAAGNKAVFDDYPKVRANFMVCVVGGTGTGKSIAMSALEELIGITMPFKKETSAGVRMVGGAGSGEAMLDQFVNVVTDTATNQTISFPVNGLIKEDELASLSKKINRHGNTSREVIMSLYDRSLPVKIVSRGAGEVTATDHFMQMISSTQPESLRHVVTGADADAGFLNRWIYVFGTGKDRPPRSTFRPDIRSCSTLLGQIRAWSSQDRLVKWNDPKAGQMWDEFYEERIRPMKNDQDVKLAQRLDLLGKKLLLVLALNDRSTTVFPEHVESVRLMWDYLLQCYGIVEGRIGQNDLEVCMNAMEKYMKERPHESFSVRQLTKQSGARKFGRETVIRAVDVLVKVGIMSEVPRAKSERGIKYMFNSDDTHTAKLVSIAGGKA